MRDIEKLKAKSTLLNSGDILRSRYRILHSLGSGGFSRTYLAEDLNRFNAGDCFSEAIDRGAEVIMLAANTGTLDKALQVLQVNDKRLSLLGGDVYTPKTLQIAGEAAEDMVLAIPWHIKSSLDSKFASTARQLWGGDVNWRTATAYDAAQALIAAIAYSPQPTRISVRQNLADPNLSTSGVDGRVSFLPSGDRLGNIQLVKIKPSSGDKFNFEFTPIAEPK